LLVCIDDWVRFPMISTFEMQSANLRKIGSLLVLGIALALGGCLKSRSSGSDITGSIAQQTARMTDAEKRVALEQTGRQYDKKPGDKVTAMTYARLLREAGQTTQAVAVMQALAVKIPNDPEVAGALGMALADGGRFAEAQEVLTRAHTAERPNWRILSTQGAISDQIGDHTKAQQYYQTALQIAPGEPTILSNLGLSYALSNRLAEADQVLRQAIAHPQATPRMRGNMALVMALQGRYQEAEQMASRDLSPEEAAANMSFLRSMTAQNNSWRQLQQADRQPQAAAQAGSAPKTAATRR
jgi:Flp pilus assembly protein TadD